jgi:acetyl esterase/lipase
MTEAEAAPEDTQPPAEGRGVYVPGRWVPAPATVSPHAQAFLANPVDANVPYPPDLSDKEAWRVYIAAGDENLTQMMALSAHNYPCRIIEHAVGDVTLFEVIPETMREEDAGCAIFYLHGGAFIHGSGIASAYMAQSLAHVSGIRALAIDYRMPPDHPYPIGLNDAVAGYRAALERFSPEHVAVAGGSSGGGLAASLVLKLRDLGLPMPAACVLATPEADLTEAGDTFETNQEVDVVLRRRLTPSVLLYADGHDLRDPYLSAVFADFSRGFPATLLMSGTRDLFLSNTVRLHRAMRKAGIEADLHVWEAMPHAGFFGAPEDQEMLEEQARFIRRRLGASDVAVETM